MSCIKGLLGGLCLDVEKGLRPYLDDVIKGYFIGKGLPQNWVFRTETEIATFHVSKDGRASVKDREVKNPDVVVEWSHDYLATVLTNRSSSGIPPGERPKYLVFTKKGRIGLGILKERLGLKEERV